MELGCIGNYHKGWTVLRIYVNQQCPKCGSASRSRGFQPGEGPGWHLLRNCENFADGSLAALISSVSCWVTDWVHVLMIPTVTESSPGPGGVMTVELIPIKTSAAASWSFTSSYLALEPWLTCGWWQLQSAPSPMNCGWSVGIERLSADQDATKPKQSLNLHYFGLLNTK